MTSIINKILGKDDDKHSHSTHSHSSDVKCSSDTCAKTATGGAHTVEGRTVQHEGVNIKSTVTSDVSSSVQLANQQKLTDLLSRLGATHSQIDDYAKQQTDKINDEIQREIDQVVARTRTEQENLLRKANDHTAQIDSEYRAKLQKVVEEIDATKAKRIADIEKDLNDQQAAILKNARNDIDQLNKKAANLKIGVLNEAQARAAADAKEISAQAGHLGQSSTVHQTTGTTTIKTEVTAASSTKDAGGVAATGANATTIGNVATGSAASHDSRTIETSSQHSSHKQ